MIFVNTLQQSDYQYIQDGVKIAKATIKQLMDNGAHIVIACEQRWWEYGSGIQLLLNHFGSEKEIDVLDVGSGWSGFGPAVRMFFNGYVSEYEPVAQYRNDRRTTINALRQYGKADRFFIHDFSLETMPAQDYDAVFCISVLEHVSKKTEIECWKNLASKVRPGGIMFITCDVVEDPTKPHIYDEMREMPNYTLENMRDRVKMLVEECNMKTIGMPDYIYHGNMVHDFTFFRAGFVKDGINEKSIDLRSERTGRKLSSRVTNK